MDKFKLNLVDGKRVAIIKSYPHTYHVRFVKSGKFMEIKKSYVKTVYVTPKKRKPYDKGDKNSQTKLKL